MNIPTNFLLRLVLFSLGLGIAFYFIQPVMPVKMAFAGFWWIQLMVFFVTISFHFGLMRAGERGDQAFIRFFMGATAVKLFLYMVIMIGYALFNKETAVGFIIHLFLFYLLYTAFEVASVYHKFSSPFKDSAK